MTLNERLQQIKTASRSKLPEATAAVMTRATEQLKSSGIVKMALGPGQPAPDFELPDWRGDNYSSRSLLADGPLLLTFFRGSW